MELDRTELYNVREQNSITSEVRLLATQTMTSSDQNTKDETVNHQKTEDETVNHQKTEDETVNHQST